MNSYNCKNWNWEGIVVAGCLTNLGWEDHTTATLNCQAKYLTQQRKGPGGSETYCRAIPALRIATSNIN